MSLRFKQLVRELGIEGKVLILRTIMGIIAGILCFVIDVYITPLTGTIIYSIYAWGIAFTIYALSIPLVYVLLKVKKGWILFGKGIFMYFLAWFIAWITIYDTYAYFFLVNITSTK